MSRRKHGAGPCVTEEALGVTKKTEPSTSSTERKLTSAASATSPPARVLVFPAVDASSAADAPPSPSSSTPSTLTPSLAAAAALVGVERRGGGGASVRMPNLSRSRNVTVIVSPAGSCSLVLDFFLPLSIARPDNSRPHPRASLDVCGVSFTYAHHQVHTKSFCEVRRLPAAA